MSAPLYCLLHVYCSKDAFITMRPPTILTRQQERRYDELSRRVDGTAGAPLDPAEEAELEVLRVSYNRFIEEGLSNMRRMVDRVDRSKLLLRGSIGLSLLGGIIHSWCYLSASDQAETYLRLSALSCTWAGVIGLVRLHGTLSVQSAVICYGLQLVTSMLTLHSAAEVPLSTLWNPAYAAGLSMSIAVTVTVGLLLCKLS